jgi:hypothetical protein
MESTCRERPGDPFDLYAFFRDVPEYAQLEGVDRYLSQRRSVFRGFSSAAVREYLGGGWLGKAGAMQQK